MLDHLPVPISYDILLRLPINCLIRCTSVSKPWLSIIRNSCFIDAHRRHGHERFLLMHGQKANPLNYDSYNWSLELAGHDGETEGYEEIEDVYSLRYDNPALDEYCKVDFGVLPKDRCLMVVNTCHGLVFLADNLLFADASYILWNPSIRKAVILPQSGVSFHCLSTSIGFGFDSVTRDYKVVRLGTLKNCEDTDNPTVAAEVYSLARGSWRSLSVAPPCRKMSSRHAFFNGNIHWVTRSIDGLAASCGFIVSFDLVSESFLVIPGPKDTDMREFDVTISGDRKYLALFTSDETNIDETNIEIWMMKEYREQKSWTKISISLERGYSWGRAEIIMPLCFRLTGEILLKIWRKNNDRRPKVVSLDLDSQQMTYINTLEYGWLFLDYYEESLVLLDVDNAISCEKKEEQVANGDRESIGNRSATLTDENASNSSLVDSSGF